MLKIQFSILAIIGLTAYIALSIAAFMAPYSVAGALTVYLFFGLLAYSAIIAASDASSFSGVFSRGFFACAVVYALAEQGQGEFLSDFDWFDLPHSYLVNIVAGREVGTTVVLEDDDAQMELLAFHRRDVRMLASIQFASAFGLLGGSLSIARARRIQRQQSQSHLLTNC